MKNEVEVSTEVALDTVTENVKDISIKNALCIGIDFGGVLSIHDRGDRSGEHKSVAINMPDGMKSLAQLKKDGHQLHLISFCGKKRAQETRQSLSVVEELCSQYYVKDKTFKKSVCKFLGCDIMIDDNLDILIGIVKMLPNIVCIFFQGDPGWEESNQKTYVKNIIKASSWLEVLTIINQLNIKNTNKPDLTVDLASKIYV